MIQIDGLDVEEAHGKDVAVAPQAIMAMRLVVPQTGLVVGDVEMVARACAGQTGTVMLCRVSQWATESVDW